MGENEVTNPTAEVENVASSYHTDEFLNELYTKMNSKGQDINTCKRRVGDAGLQPGDTLILTGELVVAEIKDDDGNVNGYYPAFATTTPDRVISVKQFMGASAIIGFNYDNKTQFEHHYYENGEKKVDLISSAVVAGFDGKTWFKPAVRVLEDFIVYVRTHKAEFANKKVTYIGTLVRPYEAKTADSFGNESWDAGFKRVRKLKLWKKAN